MRFRVVPARRLLSLTRFVALGLLAAAGLQAVAARAEPPRPPRPGDTAAAVDPSLFKALKWRSIGPYRGGRALAVSGRARRPRHLLLRRGRRRCLEDHRRRRHLEVAVRRHADRLDRGYRDCPVRPEHHLCRHRRGGAARRHYLRRRRLQVHRRRQDLDQPRARGQPPDRRADRRPEQSGHRAGRSHRPRLRAQHRARRVPHDRRRQDLDQGAVQGRRDRRDRRQLRSARLRASSTPRCGRCGASRGTSRAAARAAGCIARPTAA